MNTTAIYAVLDVKAECIIGNVFTDKAPASAIRTFGDLLKDTRTIVGMHPEDFNLICLGCLDANNNLRGLGQATDSGVAIITHDLVITGRALYAAQNPEPSGPELVKEAK